MTGISIVKSKHPLRTDQFTPRHSIEMSIHIIVNGINKYE